MLLLLIEEHQYKIRPREEVGSITGKNSAALEQHSQQSTFAAGQELLQGAITQQPRSTVPVPAAPW